MTDWTNRIVGYGAEPPDQLLANPRNFRIHPRAQQEALGGALDTLGWVQDVLVNKTTGHVIDGHLRVALALRTGQASVPVKYVELTEAEEAQALMSLDPIAAMAGTDKDKLEELLRAVNSDDERVQEYLAGLAKENGIGSSDDETYTRNIEAPIYTPKGDKPAIQDLYDDTKYKSLILEIDAADIPDDIKAFLRVAACRHIVFNYKRIAEYYAHSEAPAQRLMENSALIIIDFNRAIELGYVKLSKEIASQYKKDYGDA